MKLPILSDEQLEADIRKDYDWFRIKNLEAKMADVLVWTREAQRDLDRINALRWFVEWLEAHKCQFSERENIIITPEDYQRLKAELEGRWPRQG